MFDKVGNIGGILGKKSAHPLANPLEIKRVVADLPKDNAFKAVDELTGWLESLTGLDEFPSERLFEAALAFEDAAAAPLGRLAREYFQTGKLSRGEETRLWTMQHGFWRLLSLAYERCLLKVADKPRPGELGKLALPRLVVRMLLALGQLLKWNQLHYDMADQSIWRSFGIALRAAEAAGIADKAVVSGGRGMPTPIHAFARAMVFQAASLDSLQPLEIEAADRLIGHFSPGFVFSDQAQPDSVYWIDLQEGRAPQRLARAPAQVKATQRFLKPGKAYAEMQALLETLGRGTGMPPQIDLGENYPPELLIRVLKHLCGYLAPVPPQRRYDRHRVTDRMAVLNGLVNAYLVFSGEFGGRPAGLAIENWVVENVSRGGFGAVLDGKPGDWLKIGALTIMQPEGGDNWLIGIVRRCRREGEQVKVGIETLARQVEAHEARVRSASSGASGITPILLLRDGGQLGEVRVVLPAGSFSLADTLECWVGAKRLLLSPVALSEQAADYELARYRESGSA